MELKRKRPTEIQPDRHKEKTKISFDALHAKKKDKKVLDSQPKEIPTPNSLLRLATFLLAPNILSLRCFQLKSHEIQHG